VERTPYEFLARSSLAQDENRGIGRSDDFDLSEDNPKGSATTNNPLKLVFRRRLVRESKSLRFMLAPKSNRNLVLS
jgi:hypothetical protein